MDEPICVSDIQAILPHGSMFPVPLTFSQHDGVMPATKYMLPEIDLAKISRYSPLRPILSSKT